MTKRLRYAVEGAFVSALFALFRLLPLPLASYMGGAVAGALGPMLPVHARARQNLARAMP